MEKLAENTFIGHLLELRRRVLVSVIAIFVGFLVSYPFSKTIYNILAAPLIAVLPKGSHLIYTSLPEVFLTYIQLSLISGFVLALPVVLYQFWAFLAPGLYEHERKAFFPLAEFSGIGLFEVDGSLPHRDPPRLESVHHRIILAFVIVELEKLDFPLNGS